MYNGGVLYLDYAATTPVRPEAIQAMQAALEHAWGNPSSAHGPGQAARDALELARAQVAGLVGAAPEEVLFTSGGTEANNLALRGVMRAMRGRGRHMITTAIEHSAVLATARDLAQSGYELTVVGVGPSGVVDPEDVRRALRPDTVLVSVMHANNEIGTLQPLAEIGHLVREHGAYFHSDAVQTAGKLPLSFRDLPVDLLSLASHKIYGPKGVGALVVAADVPMHAILTGGSHERGLRAGTENVPGIVGFGAACAWAARELDTEAARLAALGRRLREGLLAAIPGARLNGDPERRVPTNVNLTIPGVAGSDLLSSLDRAGIAASAGSACRAQSKAPSHVLEAIGATAEAAAGSLRLTVGRSTTAESVEEAIAGIAAVATQLQGEREVRQA